MNGKWHLIVVSLVGLILAFIAGLALALGPASKDALIGAPTLISYQGQVTVDGSAFHGTGYFKFAVVDAAGTATYWSNDGTSSGGGEPTNGVSLPVANGLFNILLGDTSLTNMTQPLSAAAFGGTERYLRVWFSDDSINFQQLNPDRRIAAVPYALQASNTDTLDGFDASDLSLPNGALVLGWTPVETTLIDAGFSYTGVKTDVDAWSTRADMPTPRLLLAAAAVDGVIYAIGGTMSDPYDEPPYTFVGAVEAYDPATNSWSSRAPMPTPRFGLAAATVDGVVYVVGGASSTTMYEVAVEAYDPATNTWDSTLAPMPTGRALLAAVEIDGVIYAIGGLNDSNTLATNEAYDPATDTWDNSLAPMLTGRASLAAAAVDGVIYTLGGTEPSLSKATEAYDVATDTWSTRAPMPTGRYSLAAGTMDGIIYAIGGTNGVSRETANDAYDPATDTWSTRAPMPTGRDGLAATAVHGVIYAIGGRSVASPYEVTVEAYTPALYVYTKE
jgi:hypothetical protein